VPAIGVGVDVEAGVFVFAGASVGVGVEVASLAVDVGVGVSRTAGAFAGRPAGRGTLPMFANAETDAPAITTSDANTATISFQLPGFRPSRPINLPAFLINECNSPPS
jgi:hypothetical protein